ncbi:MAG: CHAT domain-containing protein [Rivularia sp. (in: Bacteria)]|nr:CHAT domain-containing protein [Rivularia sp. MS3]
MKNKHRKIRISRIFTILFLSSLIFCLLLGRIPFINYSLTSVNAQTTNAELLVNKGVKYYSNGNYQTAIKQWLEALKIYQTDKNISNEVIVRENLARTYPQIGRISEAIQQWEEVASIYRQLKNANGVGLSLAEQAQLYSNLGQPRKAIAILCSPDNNSVCTGDSVLQVASNLKNSTLEAVALGSLGDAYRLTGDYDKAIEKLESSLKIARKLKNQDYIISATNSLGNAYNSQALLNYRRADLATESADNIDAPQQFIKTAREKDTRAISYLNQSLNLAKNQKDYQAQIQALRSIIPIYYRTNNTTAINTLQQAVGLLEYLPQNRERLYATIDLARLLQNKPANGRSKVFECQNSDYSTASESLLKNAMNISNQIGDLRGKSFALGQLGHIYECQNQYNQALEITKQARVTAEQDLKAKDSLYLWEWQTGRIFKAQNKTDEAISAYSLAMNTLEDIRQDILTANRDIQFDFRDTIEPIYRDVVELRLSLESSRQATNKSLANNANNDNLTSIINTVNSLKLAQLQNFFGNNCIIDAFVQKEVDKIIDNTTAVFSTIILEDKIAIILSLPDGRKEYRWYDISQEKLFAEINEYRKAVQRYRKSFNLELAKNIYDWMIAPFDDDLQKNGIKTLVFIHDGILQSVPMAPLYDGEQYLIQKYAIATTPSLSLTNPQPLNRQNLQVLALGLTEAANINGNQFPALEYVDDEIDGIKQQIPGKKLLDTQFTRENLEKELKQEVYPIIHLATHGQFGTDPENTFIVTGNNQKLTFSQLDRLIRSVTRNREPLELLTLTACETAVGNNRSALGLAGVAIQAGAKSAVASLWAINDDATAVFANDFYAQLLSDSKSKAEALQAAQLKFINEEGSRNKHPAYWSPFVLIGNWL